MSVLPDGSAASGTVIPGSARAKTTAHRSSCTRLMAGSFGTQPTGQVQPCPCSAQQSSARCFAARSISSYPAPPGSCHDSAISDALYEMIGTKCVDAHGTCFRLAADSAFSADGHLDGHILKPVSCESVKQLINNREVSPPPPPTLLPATHPTILRRSLSATCSLVLRSTVTQSVPVRLQNGGDCLPVLHCTASGCVCAGVCVLTFCVGEQYGVTAKGLQNSLYGAT